MFYIVVIGRGLPIQFGFVRVAATMELLTNGTAVDFRWPPRQSRNRPLTDGSFAQDFLPPRDAWSTPEELGQTPDSRTGVRSMGHSPSKSKEIRAFAESVIKELKEEPQFDLYNTDGLATSLVRQWLTYDGTAALHVGSALLFLSLTRSPLGAYSLKSETSGSNWLKELMEDWNVPEDDLKGMIDQLNLSQSAEITNRDGMVVRWYVNPKQRCAGIEHNSPKNASPSPASGPLVRIAEHLERALSGQIPEDEIPILARSVLDQCNRYHGHAAVFTEEAKISLFLKDEKEGGYSITMKEATFPTRQGLESGGVPPGEVVGAIAQLNLGRSYSFVDQNGEQVDFWQEPDQQRFMKRIRGKEKGVKSPQFLCPNCRGVLVIWGEGTIQQTCGLCGMVVRR